MTGVPVSLNTSLVSDAAGPTEQLGAYADPLSARGVEVMAPLDSRIFPIIVQGVDGPDSMPVAVWDASFIVGMACGAWIGFMLMPWLDQAFGTAGGMFCMVSILAMHFVIVGRALRPELSDGGFLRKILTDTQVSQAARDAVNNCLRVFRAVQLIVCSGTIAMYISLFYNFGATFMDFGRWDFVLSCVTFDLAFIMGSFRFAATMMVVLSTIEVLRDRAAALALRTSSVLGQVPLLQSPEQEGVGIDGPAHAQTIDSILADANDLGADLGKAHRTLHSGMVGMLAWCMACSIMFSTMAFLPGTHCTAGVCTWPPSFWIAMATMSAFTPTFSILRGPFRLTGQIDSLNDMLAELRKEQRRVVSANELRDGEGGESAGAPHVGREAAGAAGAGHRVHAVGATDRATDDGRTPAVYRPSRVQWLLSYNEDEMAQVVATVSQTAEWQLETRQHATTANEDDGADSHTSATTLPT